MSSMSPFFVTNTFHDRSDLAFVPKKLTCWSLLASKICPKSVPINSMFFSLCVANFGLHLGSLLDPFDPPWMLQWAPCAPHGPPFGPIHAQMVPHDSPRLHLDRFWERL